MTNPSSPSSPVPAVHAADECGWCPLCRLVAGLRADNPEGLAKVLTAAAVFAEAVRELFEPGPESAPPGEPTETPGEPTETPVAPTAAPVPAAPRVQHIRLDTEAVTRSRSTPRSR
jgi:hypothetical protein